MAQKGAPIVLVLICGPPASGKTTLAVNLTKELSQCLRLSFDEIFSAEEQEAAVKTKGHLKILRRSMLEGVLDILDGRRNSELARKIFEGMNLDERRHSRDGPWQYIIIDDNLYLKSMRYCWFQAAKNRGLSLCNIYVTAPLEECLHRNRQRTFPVRESIIVDQFQKMEPPISDEHEADKFSFTVRNQFDASQHVTILQSIIATIKAAQLCPFSPQDCKAVEKEAEFSRTVTRASKSHNLDLAFRKAIAGLIKNETCGQKKQQIWTLSNSLKNEILNEPRLHLLSSQLQRAAGTQRNNIETELQTIIAMTLADKLSRPA